MNAGWVVPKRKQPWTRCSCGKRGYKSESSARSCFAKRRFLSSSFGVLERETARKGKGGNRFGVYKCPESGLWHLTDREKSQRMGKPRQHKAKRRQENRSARRNWRRKQGEENDQERRAGK